MGDVQVRRAAADDWPLVKHVRLRALADAPSAFGSTLAREAAFDDAEWQRRVAEGGWFLAEADGDVVGVAAMAPDRDDPRDRVMLALWVDPAWRGSAVAAALMEARCAAAEGEGAPSAVLWVAADNCRARRFFDKAGFEPTGRAEPLREDGSGGLKEQMRRLLGHRSSGGKFGSPVL